ncbi:hypothetical protein KY289_034814 [Solanum tuberosum]|nr:hypothetical protein KY289_034814 [Solanum tuberosum]
MAKTRGGIVKRFVPKPSKSPKRKVEETLRSSKKKKIVVEEPKSNSDSDTMAEIDNYEDSSTLATDDVESSEENTDSGDEESNRDSRDTGDEDDDLLSLPTCAREISEFALIMRLNCSAYPRDAKMKKVLQKGEKFFYKVTKNKKISGTKLMSLIKGTRLNKEQKLKCSLVWFVHSMLLAHDRSKIVDSNHIKMVDDLDFFKSYQWGKECFDLTVKYLKNKINLKKQSEVYKERGNASYACMASPGWHTTKSDNIVEGDPFKYKGRSTEVVHPYLIPTVHETKQNYMATLKPSTNEVKGTIIDTLKASLKGVTVLTSAVENEEDEILATDLAAVNEDYTTPTTDKDDAAIDVDEILPLAIVDEDLVAIDEYSTEEVNEQDEEREEEKLEENKEEIEEKLEE